MENFRKYFVLLRVCWRLSGNFHTKKDYSPNLRLQNTTTLGLLFVWLILSHTLTVVYSFRSFLGKTEQGDL